MVVRVSVLVFGFVFLFGFTEVELFFCDKKINDKCRLFLPDESFMLIFLVIFLPICLASFLIAFKATDFFQKKHKMIT